jgi:DNA-binding IclR family transcriptional regulator
MPNVTLEKGLIVLEAMASDAKEFSLSEISELTGLSRSHACKLLATLVSCGYVVKNPETRNYQIGLRSLELSASILDRMEVRRVGLTYLHDLSDSLNSPSYIGLLHQCRVLTVETVYPAGVYNTNSPGFGSTMPLYDSAMGWALLASMSVEKRREYIPENSNLSTELAEVEQSGVAVIQRPRGEHPAIVGVAAVVKNYQGIVIAALGASTSKKEWDGLDQGNFKNAVVKAASGLSFALGYAAGRLVLEGLKK